MALVRAAVRLAGAVATPASLRVALPVAPQLFQAVKAPAAFIHTPGGMDADDLRRAKDDLSDSFVEAREAIEDAQESKGTSYYAEDLDDAIAGVQGTLDQFKELQMAVSTEQAADLTRSLGLKMEQLKAELEILLEDQDH